MYLNAFFLLTRNGNRLTRKDFPSGNKQAGSPSEEFVAVNDDNVCTAPIRADNDFLEFVQSSKNIDADSNDENETNNVVTDHAIERYVRLFKRTFQW
ncbi:hypothetical protein TNCV_2012981 [Trichonephila clavipes]|nr:hypothetical protein TNCV_2012981 [Trichonephila clavipes]